MSPTTVTAHRGPDGEVLINPLLRGAVVDWKATAHDLAEQLLHRFEDDVTIVRQLQDELGHARLTVATVRAHWLSRWFPADVRASLHSIDDL